MNKMFDKKFEIARNVVLDKLVAGKSFSYEEVHDEIIRKGGSFGIGYTLGMFLEKQEDRGVICYNSNLDKFEVYKTLD